MRLRSLMRDRYPHYPAGFLFKPNNSAHLSKTSGIIYELNRIGNGI